MSKNLAILTSGGDAPGMNTAIWGAVMTALNEGMQIWGVMDGYEGLVKDRLELLTYNSISDIQRKGGTILRTARCLEFKESPEVRARAVENLRRRGIDGMVLIGGDGTFRGGQRMAEAGMRVVGIPGSIDNDLTYTDTTIGFDSALNTVLENLSRITDSASSHTRVSVVEIMGRNCGDLTLYAAIATGALAALVPERSVFDDDRLVAIIENHKNNKNRPLDLLVLVAEGMHKVGDMNYSFDLARRLEARTGLETRATVLGYLQRGGRPSAADRVFATDMGHRAVLLLKDAIDQDSACKRVMGIKGNAVGDWDMEEALSQSSKMRRPDFLNMIEKLSMLKDNQKNDCI